MSQYEEIKSIIDEIEDPDKADALLEELAKTEINKLTNDKDQTNSQNGQMQYKIAKYCAKCGGDIKIEDLVNDAVKNEFGIVADREKNRGDLREDYRGLSFGGGFTKTLGLFGLVNSMVPDKYFWVANGAALFYTVGNAVSFFAKEHWDNIFRTELRDIKDRLKAYPIKGKEDKK